MRQAVDALVRQLENNQATDGSWRYCCESGPMTDAYMILLLRALGLDDKDVIQPLSSRILSLQNDHGAWSLFHDEPGWGNLSATVESYYALLSTGHGTTDNNPLERARYFIRHHGGLAQIGTSTRAMLACIGQLPWKHYQVPLIWTLLPKWFPVNFFDFVGYARGHIAPVLIAAHCETPVTSPDLPDLSTSLLESTQKENQTHKQAPLRRSPLSIKTWSLRRLEHFLLQHIEHDGTLMSYASATFFMIYALLGLGYPKNHPTIVRAIEGLKSFIYPLSNGAHLQNMTSTVWDTALMSYAVQTIPHIDTTTMVRKAQTYLLVRQHHGTRDLQPPDARNDSGGWGFSDVNTLIPDVDDTTAALRALTHSAKTSSSVQCAWKRGLNWVLSMQNSDGGWPAFERNKNKRIVSNLAIDGAKATLTDPSCPDLTGRTLEFLCNDAGYTQKDKVVQRAVHWLLKHQEVDGSWYGRWGICFIYGTWAALTGLLAAGLDASHPSIRRAVAWLHDIQNADGGWGETCLSDTRHAYVPLGRSTLSQTAWATDALIIASSHTMPAIEHGIRFLSTKVLAMGKAPSDWTTSYPTGGGLPGGFYIHFHSYNTIWPLLTFGHYLQKFQTPNGS
ncbi:terpene cyclase/mutase family protein [Alicyclobacillus suci]|uniref:terpene cyclase/mutase family protein n=1 Tax=Alicyclobacillus suci TaxID=2816080 RepID=UPI001A8CF284|nr:prenyltransferase/squalene oxidase repeat-containing protein [Alicyclobacillus suci]